MDQQNYEANFSTLILSLGSTSLISMGIAPDPNTGQTQKNLAAAKFNIDLLILLREKTKGNLDTQEENFLSQMIADLQLKYTESCR